ncbi:hypothetical protein BSKO_14075 [Bryopsis sp. KO-2023]|nr:hypothetical protein BSKO_14075 [Bryopsis sp. KO-2023]
MAFSKALCLFVLACAASSAFGSIETENALGSARKLLGGCGWCKIDGCNTCKFRDGCHKYCADSHHHKPSPPKADALALCDASGHHDNVACKAFTETATGDKFAAAGSFSKGTSGGSSGIAGAGAQAHGDGAKAGTFTNTVVGHGSSVAASKSSAQGGR